MNSDNSIETLRSFLHDLPRQKIKDNSPTHNTICEMLGNCWSKLGGSNDNKTSADKLYRAEKLEWNPPILTFELERHGGTVLGSTRADVHLWSVDIARGKAEIYDKTYRQVSEKAPAIKTKPIAEEIAKLILDGVESPKLTWNPTKDYVVLEIGKIIPDTSYQQTTSGRRARFKAQLEEIIAKHGWKRQDKGLKTGFARITEI
jgi:hypothetical protein